MLETIKSRVGFSRASATVWLGVLVIVLLSLGSFFRFANLEQQPYWADEVHTSILISGHSFKEHRDRLQSGEVLSFSDLQEFQGPDSEVGVLESAARTVSNLAREDNRHTPLYYTLITVWAKLFGHSVLTMRAFSVFASILIFPALYWLCKELNFSPGVTWLALALVAVSPAHVLFAQETRPYSQWVLILVLSSASLLRAMRLPSKVNWLLYALTVSLGLYTQILAGLVAIGHGVYVLVLGSFRFRKPFISYVAASLLGFLAFLPWLLVIIFIKPVYNARTEWQLDKQSLLSTLIRWSGIVSRTFVDFGIKGKTGQEGMSVFAMLPTTATIFILLLLSAYAVYFLCRKAPVRVWLFVLTFMGVSGLALFLPDVLFGLRQGTTRFIFPTILGIELAVAYLLGTQISQIHRTFVKQGFWRLVTVGVLSIGIFSCVNMVQSEVWWNKKPEANQHNPKIARIINRSPKPLLVTDGMQKPIQTLSYVLDSDVRYQIVKKTTLPELPTGFSDIYLLNPSDQLRSGLQTKYGATSEEVVGPLWKLSFPTDSSLASRL